MTGTNWCQAHKSHIYLPSSYRFNVKSVGGVGVVYIVEDVDFFLRPSLDFDFLTQSEIWEVWSVRRHHYIRLIVTITEYVLGIGQGLVRRVE